MASFFFLHTLTMRWMRTAELKIHHFICILHMRFYHELYKPGSFPSCFNTKGLLYIAAVYHSINHGIAGVYSTCVRRQSRQQIKGKSQDTGSCANVCIQKSWVGNVEPELWLMIQPEITITEAPWCLFAPGRGCASLSWPLWLYVAKGTVWNWVLCLKCQWSVQFYAVSCDYRRWELAWHRWVLARWVFGFTYHIWWVNWLEMQISIHVMKTDR